LAISLQLSDFNVLSRNSWIVRDDELRINYSTQAADLLKQGKIQVERFKCPDWPDMIAEASQLCPVAVHVNLKAGVGN